MFNNPTQWAWRVAFVTALLYIHTAGPSLVPYRDAGEMATTVPTLGIIHPTSYPVYSIAGHLFSELPLGNPAYRLNVFSALCAAAAWAFLFLFLSESFTIPVALVTVLIGAVSYQFWTHALVSEMYSLNLLFLTSILWTVHKRHWSLSAFLMGLGLANRPDLLLTLPAFVFLSPVIPAGSRPGRHTTGVRPQCVGSSGVYIDGIIRCLFFFVLGLSAYLYLPLRALQHPWLNWNDPSTFDRLMRTLLRRGYGSTLDLLSTSYQTGENFISELLLYGRHSEMDFIGVGPFLALGGCFTLYRLNRRLMAAALTGLCISGVLFIFLGNLPPNPHAVAIVEAGYLNPDIFFLILIAAGLFGISTRWPRFAAPLFLLIACATLSFSIPLYPQVSRRANFLAVDFARNVYHSMPESSLIVGKSDVPVFSLFYGHWIYPCMKDRWPLGQGLVASAWYQRMMGEQSPGLEFTGLHALADWTLLSKLNPDKTIFSTGDIDWPENPGGAFQAQGLVNLWNSSRPGFPAPPAMPRELLIQRGTYRYTAYRDFFSSELVEEYSRAALSEGQAFTARQDWPRAHEDYLCALVMKPAQPYAAFSLGYMALQTQDLSGAVHYYAWAVDLFDQLLMDARDWKSFLPLIESLRTDKAQALAQWGVAEERRGNVSRAQALYQAALEVDPASADAHYNMAVLDWKEARWTEVVEHLQAMAKDHPDDPRWKRYLPGALAHLK